MARDFSGTSQYGNFTAPSYGGSHTLMCWVNADTWDVDADDFGVCGLFAPKGQWGSDAAGDSRLTVIKTGVPTQSELRFQVHTGTADYQSTYQLAGNSVSTGAWHHVVGQYDESITRLRIYLDGVAHGDATSAGTYSNRSVSGAVGAYPNNETGTEFNGRVAEIAIWNRALVEDEIIALSKGYSPLFFRRGLIFYSPMWGKSSPEQEIMGAANVTITGATEAVHPPIRHNRRLNSRLAGYNMSASGAVSLSQVTASGAALKIEPITSTGTPSLPQLQSNGTGGSGNYGGASVTLPQIVDTASAISGPYASGSPSLQKLQSRAESTTATPIIIDDDGPQIVEWILPLSTAVYPHVFTAPVQIVEWVLPQSSFPQYKNISILHLPSYGIFMHSPFFPYKRIRDITHLVSNIDRSYERMSPGHASFTIPQLPSSDHSVHEGNIVVIQTSDQPVWAGPIYTDETQLGTGTTQIHALDMGSLLARRNIEQTEHYTTAIGSGFIVRSMINKMNARGATGIIFGRIDPGPTIYDLEIGGQSVLDGLNEIHDRTDWEWWIENEATPHKLVSRFYWSKRQGIDYSRTAHFWYSHHFVDGTLTHDLSEGKQVSIVVGGGFSKIWKRNSASASAISGQKVNWQSILNQLTPELNVRTNNQLPAALRDERQRVDVMTENSSELIRSAERDAVRKLYAETTLQLTLIGDRRYLQVGNYVTIHAPLGQHGELDGAVRLVEVQPDDELGPTLITAEVRL